MADIRYNFVASGQESVGRAFDGIEKRAIESAKATERAYKQTVVAAKQTASARDRVERSPANRTATLARQVERDQVRATERETARRRQLIRSQIATAEQSGREQARVEERFRRQRERDTITGERRFQQRLTQARRQGATAGRAGASMSSRLESSRDGASFGGIVKEMFSGNSIRSAIGSLGSVIKGVAMGAVGSAVALGVGVTGAATKDAMRTQEIANRVSINSRGAGKTAVDASVLRREFEATAAATPGQTAAGIGEAIQAYVTKTGNLGQARKFSGTFATVASATGGDITDIANAAADISQKFDITSLEEMREALAALTFQGKDGAFELSAAAEKFARMGSAASAFGFNKGVGGLKTLGGLSQIIQGSTGNADVTSTALSAMLRQFVGQSGKIKKLTGVDVFKDKGRTQTRDIQDLLVETIAGAKGDQAKIQDIFGDEGGQAIKPMLATFNQASAALGPKATEKERVDAGKAALRSQLDKAINAPGDFSEVQKDASQAQQDTSAKLTAAWEKITAAVGEKLLPVIAEFAERIADTPELIDAFKTALETLIKMLEDLGVIKAKTIEQRRTESEGKAIAAGNAAAAIVAEAGGPGGKMTDAQISEFAAAKAAEIVESRKAAEAQTLIDLKNGTATKKQILGLNSGMTALSPEQISAAYLALGKKDEFAKDKMAEYANYIGHGAATGRDEDFLTSGKRRKVGATNVDETDEQIAFRQKQTIMRATNTATGANEEQWSAAAAAIREAAEALKKNAGNQPSTVAPVS